MLHASASHPEDISQGALVIMIVITKHINSSLRRIGPLDTLTNDC